MPKPMAPRPTKPIVGLDISIDLIFFSVFTKIECRIEYVVSLSANSDEIEVFIKRGGKGPSSGGEWDEWRLSELVRDTLLLPDLVMAE